MQGTVRKVAADGFGAVRGRVAAAREWHRADMAALAGQNKLTQLQYYDARMLACELAPEEREALDEYRCVRGCNSNLYNQTRCRLRCLLLGALSTKHNGPC